MHLYLQLQRQEYWSENRCCLYLVLIVIAECNQGFWQILILMQCPLQAVTLEKIGFFA